MSSKLREIASSALGRFGIPGIANIYVLAPSAGGAGAAYWEQYCHAQSPAFFSSLTTALAGMTSGRNDVLLVTPDAHPQTAKITHSKNMTHIIGMFPNSRMNQRSRLTHTVTLPSFVEVSGYGNLLANLYLSYGYAATDVQALLISGDRNNLQNVHVLPALATALDDATFDLVRLNCGEFFASDCVFGGETVAWTNGDLLSIYGGSDRSNRSFFENCTFIMRADNAQVNFIETIAGAGNGFTVFKNCQFLNWGTSLTYAIDGAGLGGHQLFFDADCSFVGCTDIVALAYENYVWFGGVNTPINQATGGATVALFNGLACHPDVS